MARVSGRLAGSESPVGHLARSESPPSPPLVGLLLAAHSSSPTGLSDRARRPRPVVVRLGTRAIETLISL